MLVMLKQLLLYLEPSKMSNARYVDTVGLAFDTVTMQFGVCEFSKDWSREY